MIPKQPDNLIPLPFAQNGNKEIIPFEKQFSGRASFNEGFPVETQRPLTSGGIAPNRLDFQGMFYILSAAAFWTQSGGQWTWLETLNYSVPAFVFHDGKLWWCLKENGPDSSNGIHQPGDASDPDRLNYWEEFLAALANMGGASVLGAPVGSLLMFYGDAAPGGYLPCTDEEFDASTYPLLFAHLETNRTPDLRGLVPRGIDPEKKYDPDGDTRTIGSIQLDAGRRIQAGMGEILHSELFSGAVYRTAPVGNRTYPGGAYLSSLAAFDSQRVHGATHTAAEFRMTNFAILYCIKHD